jgi:hypothetical protein
MLTDPAGKLERCAKHGPIEDVTKHIQALQHLLHQMRVPVGS